MAKEKCRICSEDIVTGFMDKILGTTVEVKESGKRHVYYVCSSCQKEKGDRLKEAI
jgi:hypothetical protein